jgi:hypothetical protein
MEHHVHNYTEEFDLLSPPGAKLEWIAGGFLLYQSSDQFVLEYDGFGGLAPTPAQLSSNPPNLTTNPPANLAYGNISQVLRRSYSPFAQGTYHVADNFRITSTRSSPPSLRAPEWGFASVGQSSNLMVGACGGSVPLGAAQHFTLACLALGSFRRIPHGFKFSSSLRDWRLRYSGEPSRRRWLGADGKVIRDYRITERKIPALLARKSRESLVARLSEFLSRPLPPPPSRVSREAEAALDHSLSQ